MPHKPLHAIILGALLIVLSATFANAADSTEYIQRLERRAARAIADGEWPSANAIFTRLIEMRPDRADNYAGAMTTSVMSGDTAIAVSLTEYALGNLIPADSLFDAIGSRAFAIGYPRIYRQLLGKIKDAYPYLGRIVDRRLLDYYIFRNNGPEIVRYAEVMLEGLPDDTGYLRLLARGYMLTGRTREAADAWRRVLALHPDEYQTLLDLGNCLLAEGDRDGALPLLRHAYELRPTPYLNTLLQENFSLPLHPGKTR